MLFLKLVSDLDKECLMSLHVIGHGFEDSVDSFDSELLLDEGGLLVR